MTTRLRRRDADAARIEEFSIALAKAGPRSDRRNDSGSAGEQDPEFVREALDHLRVQHEELLVAEEELRAQVEELARTRLALEVEHERYVDLFQRAPDPFLVTDRHGAIRDANAAAGDLFGIEVRFLRGKPIVSFIEHEDVRAVRGMLSVGPTEDLLPVGIRPRSGASRRAVAHVSATSREERLLWVLRVEEDAPAPYARAATIARAVRDTEDLRERERRRRDELERASRAKDRFIAVVSHDLRGPLNAILGWTQLLRREALDHAARTRALETIERNATVQARLLEELLDVSRLAANRLHLHLAPADVGGLVERVLARLSATAAEKGVELRPSIERGVEAGALVVLADVQRLDQLLGIVVTRALEETAPGAAVDVLARREEGTVMISVRDRGRAVAVDRLRSLFDIDAVDRDDGALRGMLGLGLFIARRLVELQDGAIAAEANAEGEGTTVTVRLPHQAATVHAAAPAAPRRETLAGVRVLVVDDDEDTRDLVATVLRRADAEVASAGDAGAALDLFARWAPDVFVTDLAIPGGSGFDLVAKVREQDATVAALAMSGLASDEDAERALAAGFDVHLSKPIAPAELVEAVGLAVRTRPA